MISLRSPVAREWVAVQRESIRSWGDFVDQAKFAKPSSPQEITERLKKNVAYFQSNYLVIVAVLAAYCIITSPLLLLAIGAFFGVQHVITGKQGIATQTKVFGKELSQANQTVIAGCVSVPLFILAGATSAVFWVFGASAVIVGGHGSMRLPNVDPDEQDTFLEQA